MFELPASKRVRRSDLNRTRSSTSPSSPSPSPSPSSARSTPDPELQSQAQARFAALFGDFSLPDTLPVSNDKASDETTKQHEEDGEEEEPGFEFRLFSNSTNISAARIVLEPENDEDGSGVFLHKDRDKKHYFATPASGDRKAEFESVAVSGETVLAWRNIRARGLEVPWRVKTIKIHSSLKLQPDGSTHVNVVVKEEDGDGHRSKKGKPNKKRRVLLREKQRKRDRVEEEKKKRNEGKEAADREKKTRANRAKKVKRKMKEKAFKAGDGAGAGAGVAAATDVGVAEDVDMLDKEK